MAVHHRFDLLQKLSFLEQSFYPTQVFSLRWMVIIIVSESTTAIAAVDTIAIRFAVAIAPITATT